MRPRARAAATGPWARPATTEIPVNSTSNRSCSRSMRIGAVNADAKRPRRTAASSSRAESPRAVSKNSLRGMARGGVRYEVRTPLPVERTPKARPERRSWSRARRDPPSTRTTVESAVGGGIVDNRYFFRKELAALDPGGQRRSGEDRTESGEERRRHGRIEEPLAMGERRSALRERKSRAIRQASRESLERSRGRLRIPLPPKHRSGFAGPAFAAPGRAGEPLERLRSERHVSAPGVYDPLRANAATDGEIREHGIAPGLRGDQRGERFVEVRRWGDVGRVLERGRRRRRPFGRDLRRRGDAGGISDRPKESALARSRREPGNAGLPPARRPSLFGAKGRSPARTGRDGFVRDGLFAVELPVSRRASLEIARGLRLSHALARTATPRMRMSGDAPWTGTTCPEREHHPRRR